MDSTQRRGVVVDVPGYDKFLDIFRLCYMLGCDNSYTQESNLWM